MFFPLELTGATPLLFQLSCEGELFVLVLVRQGWLLIGQSPDASVLVLSHSLGEGAWFACCVVLVRLLIIP